MENRYVMEMLAGAGAYAVQDGGRIGPNATGAREVPRL